jgi:hypothetical protein
MSLLFGLGQVCINTTERDGYRTMAEDIVSPYLPVEDAASEDCWVG